MVVRSSGAKHRTADCRGYFERHTHTTDVHFPPCGFVEPKCTRTPENLLRTEAPNMESSFVLGTSQPLGVYHVVNEIVELRHLSVHGYPAKV
jgi:hypothetical protein